MAQRTAKENRADDPVFEVFYLEEAHAVIVDFSGDPPQEFRMKTQKHLRSGASLAAEMQ